MYIVSLAIFAVLTVVSTDKIQVLWNVAPYHIQGQAEAVLGQFLLDPEDQATTLLRRRRYIFGRLHGVTS
jgi:hypothetical protein